MSVVDDMACAEFVERVTDYLEDAMHPADRARLEVHLALCPYCATYLEQLRVTLELTGELREDDIAPEVRAELLATFERWRRSG